MEQKNSKPTPSQHPTLVRLDFPVPPYHLTLQTTNPLDCLNKIKLKEVRYDTNKKKSNTSSNDSVNYSNCLFR